MDPTEQTYVTPSFDTFYNSQPCCLIFLWLLDLPFIGEKPTKKLKGLVALIAFFSSRLEFNLQKCGTLLILSILSLAATFLNLRPFFSVFLSQKVLKFPFKAAAIGNIHSPLGTYGEKREFSH